MVSSAGSTGGKETREVQVDGVQCYLGSVPGGLPHRHGCGASNKYETSTSSVLGLPDESTSDDAALEPVNHASRVDKKKKVISKLYSKASRQTKSFELFKTISTT